MKRRDVLKAVAVAPGMASAPGKSKATPVRAVCEGNAEDVVVRFYSVFVAVEAIERKYPGGLPAFRSQIGGSVEAGLLRRTFMSLPDALDWMASLASSGLSVRDGAGERDVALASSTRGLLTKCEWLSQRPPSAPGGVFRVRYAVI